MSKLEYTTIACDVIKKTEKAILPHGSVKRMTLVEHLERLAMKHNTQGYPPIEVADAPPPVPPANHQETREREGMPEPRVVNQGGDKVERE